MTTEIVVSPLEQMQSRLAPLRERLAAHPLYSRILSASDLRIFMESHVFAVWDFMSLLKTLQARLTCVAVPWTPSAWPESRRFINEIVLGEESDVYEGRSISHFELYVGAMEELGADTGPIRELLRQIEAGPVKTGLVDAEPAGASVAASQFVASTFSLIQTGKLHAIAAAFTFGREDVIPEMFRELVRDLDSRLSGKLGKFAWYLERHIEVDGEDHGPLSLRMVADLCGSHEARWDEAGVAAEAAILARLALWDGIFDEIEASRIG